MNCAPWEARLISQAHDLGVSDARLIPVAAVVIDNKFAGFCKEPGCPGYGRSKSCPPHVMGPDRFRHYIQKFNTLLVFKFDIPWSVLLSEDRIGVNRIVHETAAKLEMAALDMGYENAQGFAGGCCKELFCQDHLKCRKLFEDGICRHPDQSRESMSGMGVDFKALAREADWEYNNNSDIGLMAGSVLLKG